MTPSVWSERARDWIALDPDLQHQAQIQALVDVGDDTALEAIFSASLHFGTGGLRAKMGPGPARLNRVVVQRLAFAMAQYLLETDAQLAAGGIAIAWDSRRNSARFALDMACVWAACGIRVHLAPNALPTPVLSFATAHLKASMGVMVTASHNPAQDNGVKVFDARGAQIVEPIDSEIASRMAKVQGSVPMAVCSNPLIRKWGDEIHDAYFMAVSALRYRQQPSSLRIVYTALHGVGGAWTPNLLRAASHLDVHLVQEQLEPNKDFPTVAFPNPEEPTTLDLARSLAIDVDADLILANDPDADRIAVAVKHEGCWQSLTGNQVAVLLADDILSHAESGDHPVIITTIVSSAMLGKIAAAHEARCIEVLTGFKWIAQAAQECMARGERFVFGAEESMGYVADNLVADKDGLGIAVLIADLANALASEGRTLVDKLYDLARQHGEHQAATKSVTCAGPDGRRRIVAAMQRLRACAPRTLGADTVCWMVDLLREPDPVVHGDIDYDLPKSDVLGFGLQSGGRVWVRPSGTEPKIKIYVEVCSSVSAQDATARVVAVTQDMLACAGLSKRDA